MKAIKELSNILEDNLSLNKHRVECLALLLVSIFLGQTTNLKRLCFFCNEESKPDSRYRRYQRFFASCCLDVSAIGTLIVNLFFGANEPFYLTIDRTNWKLGNRNINLLVLGAVYQGISLPIWWIMLNKQGNSSTQERMALLTAFLSKFEKGRVLGILADREFIGEQWFSFLINQGIPFVIRIKQNTKVLHKGLHIPVKNLFQDLSVGRKRVLKNPREIWRLKVYLSATRSSKAELVILATADQATYALTLYARRWGIESLFQCLKGRGFGFEDSRITDLQRVSTLMAVLSLAFAWAHKTGEWCARELKQLTIKKHGRPIRSIFRHGLDTLKHVLTSPKTTSATWLDLLNLLAGNIKTTCSPFYTQALWP